MELCEKTQKLLAWIFSKGIYLAKRLSVGTKPVCALFQGIIEKGVKNLLEDIIVSGRDQGEYTRNLKEIFKRLQSARFRSNKNKCVFFLPKIQYLGHVIGEKSIGKNIYLR